GTWEAGDPTATVIVPASDRVSTNAFVVQVDDTTVAVASHGVPTDEHRDATAAIRAFCRADLPVVFSSAGEGERISVGPETTAPSRTLAKAAARVAVYCGWLEGPTVTVLLNDERHTFQVRYTPD